MLWLEIQPLAESLVPLETGNHLDSVAGVLFPVDATRSANALKINFGRGPEAKRQGTVYICSIPPAYAQKVVVRRVNGNYMVGVLDIQFHQLCTPA